ncbi:MAG: hypothetical protein H6667_26130 [Ardenticatenaceae bacterium]|nr:hypothetical protein [Ardenticatenaceae bacterium]
MRSQVSGGVVGDVADGDWGPDEFADNLRRMMGVKERPLCQPIALFNSYKTTVQFIWRTTIAAHRPIGKC